MPCCFYSSFVSETDRLVKEAAASGAMRRKLRTLGTVAKVGVPVTLGLALYNIVKGVTDARDDLRREGHV